MPFLVDTLTSALTVSGRAIVSVAHPDCAASRDADGLLRDLPPAATAPGPRSRRGSTSRSTAARPEDARPRRRSSCWRGARRRPHRRRRLAAHAGPGARGGRRAGRPAADGRPRRRSPPGSCTGSPTTGSPSSATASYDRHRRRRASPCARHRAGPARGGRRRCRERARRLSAGGRAGPPTGPAAGRQGAASARPCTGRPTSTASPCRRDGAGRRGHRRAALPRAVHLRRLHRERAPGPAASRRRSPRCCAAPASPGASHSGARPAAGPRDLPARRALAGRGRRPACGPRSACCTLQERRRPGCSCAATRAASLSCLVFLPRDRYTTEVRQRHGGAAARGALDGDSVEHTAARHRVGAGPRCTSWCARRRASGCADGDRDDARAAVAGAVAVLGRRPGRGAARRAPGEPEAARLLRALADAFPDGYKEDCPAAGGRRGPAPARRAASAERRLGLQPAVREPTAGAPAPAAQALPPAPVTLSAVLPCCADLGVEVIDERPYELNASGDGDARLYDFGLRAAGAGRAGRRRRGRGAVPGRLRRGLDRRARRATGSTRWCCAAELIVAAGRRAARATLRYLRQTRLPYSLAYVADASLAHVHVARLLRRAVRDALRPGAATADREAARRRGWPRSSRSRSTTVPSLDHDRILRALLSAVRATLRTNAYQRADDGEPAAPYLSFKLDPRSVPGPARSPRPACEVWVYSPARRGRPPALRRRRARRAALVRPPRGLPHRGARAGQGADREERRHRADRRQGRLRRPSSCPTRRRPRRLVAEGIACYRTFITRAARRHRRPATGRTPCRAAGRRRPPRRRRPLPRRRRRQGHGDVLRHRQRDRRRATASGSATPSPPAAPSATTTRPWASPRAARGRASAGTSASSASTRRPRTSRSSASAT